MVPLQKCLPPADRFEETVAPLPSEPTPNTAAAEKSATDASIFPLSPTWQRPLHLNSGQRHASQDLVRLLAEEGDQQAIAWIAGEPNVDSQAIYVRSSGGLLAFERTTGKVLWTRLLDRPQNQPRQAELGMRISEGRDGSPQNADQLQNSLAILELHRDEVTAGMTSDAFRLFVLCDTGESVGPSSDFSQAFGMLPRRGDMVSRSMRELVAIEKTTGRRLWSAGGAPLEARFGNELARAWFAGPPTVSGGVLFGVVERDDAHWLVCLRSETGEVVWKLILAYPETNIFQDSTRQLTASRPLVAEGMIWTSTNDGLLIAIDALTRSVVWTRRMQEHPKDTGVPQLRNFRSRHVANASQAVSQNLASGSHATVGGFTAHSGHGEPSTWNARSAHWQLAPDASHRKVPRSCLRWMMSSSLWLDLENCSGCDWIILPSIGRHRLLTATLS